MLSEFQRQFHPVVLQLVVTMLIVSMVKRTASVFVILERLEIHMKAVVHKEGPAHQHHVVPMLNVAKSEVELNAFANLATKETLTFVVMTSTNVLEMLVVSMLSVSINLAALTVAVRNLSLGIHLSNVNSKYPVLWIVLRQIVHVAPAAPVQLDSHAVQESVETFALMSPVEEMLSALKENVDVHLASLAMLFGSVNLRAVTTI